MWRHILHTLPHLLDHRFFFAGIRTGLFSSFGGLCSLQTDDVAMTTVEKTAGATTTVDVATTIGTEIGTGKGIEIEEKIEIEIEKVDEPTGLLHATPLTTAVGLQHRVTLCQQQVVLNVLVLRHCTMIKIRMFKTSKGPREKFKSEARKKFRVGDFDPDCRTIADNRSPFLKNLFVLVTAAIMADKDAQATADKSTMGLLIVEGGFEDQVCHHASELYFAVLHLEANSRFCE